MAGRAATAKSKAQAALRRRRQVDGSDLPTAASAEAELEAAHPRQVARIMVQQPEPHVLRPHHPFDAGWSQCFQMPPPIQFEAEWTPGTLSDQNLAGYLMWRHEHPVDATTIAPDLYVIHHSGPSRDEFRNFVRSQSMDISRIEDHSNPGKLPERNCTEEGCTRCSKREGGYRFWWTSSRWTPALAGPQPEANIPPNLQRQYCRRAGWPLGNAVTAEGHRAMPHNCPP